MRWACLLLPQLALDAVLRQQTDPGAPLALIGGPRQRRVLHAVNSSAKQIGLRRGMLLSAAHALTREFHALPFDSKLEAQTRLMLASWAYGFSSQVSMVFEHALVLEIAASKSLFGGWEQLGRRLSSELGEMGFRHRLAAAPNPFAARILVNVHDAIGVDDAQMMTALARIPVERSGLPPSVTETLHRSGLRKLRQVFAVPRESMVRRFPPVVLEHLDALCGTHALPLRYFEPPDRFEARIEFEYEVESSQALLFPLRRLTSDLATFLSSRDGGAQRFALHFEHERHPDSILHVGLLTPEREASILFDLSRSRLEQLRLPEGTRGMRLVADDLPPFVPVSRDLFDARPAQALGWEQLRERLRARLGDNAVHGIRLHADHRPERATQTPVEKARPPSVQLPPRPTWLLPRPIPLRGFAHEVVGEAERIETGWWDGSDVRRDYVKVLTRDGQRAWAFRVVGDDELWLQGWFG